MLFQSSGYVVIAISKASRFVATEAYSIPFINIFLQTDAYSSSACQRAFHTTAEAYDFMRLYVIYETPVNLTFSTRVLSLGCLDVTQAACTNEAALKLPFQFSEIKLIKSLILYSG